MDDSIKAFMGSFELGAEQRHKNMSVFPILAPGNGGPDYMPLKEAFEKAVFTVTEVSAGGSVPDLKVKNKAEIPVLLLDGEELAGAKQNRVLNTTILVAAGAEVVIPVSCTEQGRWSYVSERFHESGHMLPHNLRTRNKRAVAASLESSREFRADQDEVWYSCCIIERAAGVQTKTKAMKDVFDQKKDELDDYFKAFSLEAGQKGLLVMIGDEVMGFDFVSRESAFSVLFPKLVKSYAMDAWLESRKKGGGKKSGGRGGREGKAAGEHGAGKGNEAGGEGGREGADAAGGNGKGKGQAEAFLSAIKNCGQKAYDSVGLGTDYRFDGIGIVGSMLVVSDKPVHVAFFRADEADKAGNMAGMRRRRSFRY